MTTITDRDFPGLRLVLSDDGVPAYVECLTALDNVSLTQAGRMIDKHCGQLPAGRLLAHDAPFRVHVARMAYVD